MVKTYLNVTFEDLFSNAPILAKIEFVCHSCLQQNNRNIKHFGFPKGSFSSRIAYVCDATEMVYIISEINQYEHSKTKQDGQAI